MRNYLIIFMLVLLGGGAFYWGVLDLVPFTDHNQVRPDVKVSTKAFPAIWPSRILRHATVIEERVAKEVSEKLVVSDKFRYPKLIQVSPPGRDPIFKVADHIMVDVPESSRQDFLRWVEQAGFEIRKKMNLPDHYLVSFSAESLEERAGYLRRLQASPYIDSFEEDFLVYATLSPDDPAFGQQWNMKGDEGYSTEVDLVWDLSSDCSSLKVAVFDSGVSTEHPDLVDNIDISNGKNFSSDEESFEDGSGHGSHVAGIIGAVGNNGSGIAGVCWNADIVPIKVLDDDGLGTTSDVAEGIIYAASISKVRIGNLSLTTTVKSNAMELAIDSYLAKGKLLVIASGNDGYDLAEDPVYPAAFDKQGTVVVGATGRDDTLASFSNFGKMVDVAAPGKSIFSTSSGRGYDILSGTSMATPLVTGAIALMWSALPGLARDEVIAALLEGADKKTEELGDSIHEARRLNVWAAFTRSQVPSHDLNSVLEQYGMFQVGEVAQFVLNVRSGLTKVKKVEIYFNDELLGAAANEPYEFDFVVPEEDGVWSVRITDEKEQIHSSTTPVVRISHGPKFEINLRPKEMKWRGEFVKLSIKKLGAVDIARVDIFRSGEKVFSLKNPPFDALVDFPKVGSTEIKVSAIAANGEAMDFASQVEVKEYSEVFQESHYMEDGDVVCRLAHVDPVTSKELEIAVQKMPSIFMCSHYCQVIGQTYLMELSQIVCGADEKDMQKWSRK